MPQHAEKLVVMKALKYYMHLCMWLYNIHIYTHTKMCREPRIVETAKAHLQMTAIWDFYLIWLHLHTILCRSCMLCRLGANVWQSAYVFMTNAQGRVWKGKHYYPMTTKLVSTSHCSEHNAVPWHTMDHSVVQSEPVACVHVIKGGSHAKSIILAWCIVYASHSLCLYT